MPNSKIGTPDAALFTFLNKASIIGQRNKVIKQDIRVLLDTYAFCRFDHGRRPSFCSMKKLLQIEGIVANTCGLLCVTR